MTAKELRKRTVGQCKREKCRDGFLVSNGDSSLCLCMQVFRYLRRLQRAGIPKDYWTIGLDDMVVPARYRNHVKTFLREHRNAVDHGQGMLFMGSNGIGKTTLMVEIGKHFALVGYRVAYFTVQKYMNAKFSDHPIEFDDHDVLLVDELDKAYAKPGSDWVPKTFEELVRQIVSQNRVVIMATNASENGIRELFGQSAYSAITRKIQIVPMRGKDYSKRLQESWDERLKEEFDLFHDNIVDMARHIS